VSLGAVSRFHRLSSASDDRRHPSGGPAIIALLIARGRGTSHGTSAEPAPGPGGADVGRPSDRAQVAGHEWPHDAERFRTPIDQVENYAIILLDTEGKPTSWNSGIRRVLGYDKAEFLRTTTVDLYPAGPPDRAPERTCPRRLGAADSPWTAG
jgi:PAS domain-containing protein